MPFETIARVRQSSLAKSWSMIPPPQIPRPDTLKGVDELIRANLENVRDSGWNWLLVACLVVALGVVLEGPEVIYEARETFRHLFHICKESRRPSWITLVALLGWILVALGVVGEGIAEGYVSQADGNVQTFNDIMLTDERRQTALAFERAAQAEATARGFESQIAESKATAKSAEATARQFEAHIAEAQRSAAESKKESARLTKEAEAEHLARVKIEAIMADRVFTVVQRSKLIAVLAKITKFPVTLTSLVGNPEAERYATQILTAFGGNGANWDPQVNLGQTTLTGSPPGITIGWGGGTTRENATLLQGAFAAAGIPTTIMHISNADATHILIFVSSKE